MIDLPVEGILTRWSPSNRLVLTSGQVCGVGVCKLYQEIDVVIYL
jgi:hypothetical protein